MLTEKGRMTMRLIDADNFERVLMTMPDDELCEDCCYNVVNKLDEAPIIEAEPVKHGRWEVWSRPGDEETGNCSVCKTPYSTEELFMGGTEFPKYCPECGARMDEEE